MHGLTHRRSNPAQTHIQTRVQTRVLRLGVGLALFAAPPAFSQGVLSPPGAPAPTMKSLEQIEPRKVLGVAGQTSTLGLTINTPGSYVLLGPVAVSSGNAILITTNDVILDLNGFTLSSTATGVIGHGILVNQGLSNILLRNGSIRGQTRYEGGSYTNVGFHLGVYVNTDTENVVAEDLQVHGVFAGIYCPVVRRCHVAVCSDTGIEAHTVSDSTARDCGDKCIDAVMAQNCIGSGNNIGIAAGIATHCVGESVTWYGITATCAHQCYGSSTSGIGLYASKTASNCVGTSGTGVGLKTGTASFCNGLSYGGNAIEATIAVACTADHGAIVSGSKQLGTP